MNKLRYFRSDDYLFPRSYRNQEKEMTRKKNFIRVSRRRVAQIKKMIEGLENLANKSYYSYKRHDLQKIISEIEKTTIAIKNKLKL